MDHQPPTRIDEDHWCHYVFSSKTKFILDDARLN